MQRQNKRRGYGVAGGKSGFLQSREGSGCGLYTGPRRMRRTDFRKLQNLTYLCVMRRKNERYNEPVVRGVIAHLRELRHARNLSQKQVFTDTDINIGRIESGRGNISVSTLADLCAYYGIPLREFFERLEAGSASGE